MATFSKDKLSASTDGRGINVAATSGTGTLIHAGSSTATTYDEVWLYAQGVGSTATELTIQWGAVADPSDCIFITIPAYSGLFLVVPGLVLKGNATPLNIRALASAANDIIIYGYVNRITA